MDQDTFYRLTSMDSVTRLTDARRESVNTSAKRAHDREHVAALGEVDYVNDSKSTFLDATLQCISALGRPVVWIAAHRGAELAQGPVLEFLKEHVTRVVLFGRPERQNTELLQLFEDHAYVADDVRNAVFIARELAKSGDVVLFSPACPSGEGFANYEERGMEFKRAVKDL
jgi:UDP-N-acetylmuramoylalanine--D-glutamate ligase